MICLNLNSSTPVVISMRNKRLNLAMWPFDEDADCWMSGCLAELFFQRIHSPLDTLVRFNKN